MEAIVPLSALAPQERGWVRSLAGGRSFVSRMVSLGFTPGAPVDIVQNRGRGPLIVCVRDCRVALGRGEAEKVLVQREDNSHGPAAD
jgi:ferrous iron transport protein A